MAIISFELTIARIMAVPLVALCLIACVAPRNGSSQTITFFSYPPEAYRIGSKFGSTTSLAGKNRTIGPRAHNGVDIKAPTGTPVYASEFGKVIGSRFHENFGNEINIRTTRGDLLELIYSHLDNREVEVGETVRAGQQIGTVGKTGAWSGRTVHLHYGVYNLKPGARGLLNPAIYLFGEIDGRIECVDPAKATLSPQEGRYSFERSNEAKQVGTARHLYPVACSK